MVGTTGNGDGGDTGAPAVHVLRVDHVGIAVPDADVAVERFRSLFGLDVLHREVNEDQGVDEAVLVGSGAGRGSADGPGAAVTGVQFVAPSRPDSTVARHLDKRGAGLHHLALTVTDVDAATRTLRARGIRVLYDESRPGTAGSRITFLHPSDMGGVLVELVQPHGRRGDSIPASDD